MAKILFAINNIEFLYSHRKEIVKEAIEKGLEVTIAGPLVKDSSKLQEFERWGARIIPLKMARSKANPFREISTIWQILKILFKEKPHLIHCITIKPNLYFGIVNRLFNFPIVFAVSGMGTVYIDKGFFASVRRVLLTFLFRRALRQKKSAVILQNDDDRSFFTKNQIVPSEKIEMIRGSGVDTARFVPLSKKATEPVVGFAARLLRQKGLMEFFTAAGQLKTSHCRFVLMGDIDSGNPSSFTKEEIEKKCRENAVEWWGHKEDMNVALNEIHVACLPSYREGLPKVLQEAASCGLPIVTTDVPGCRDVVTHGENGLLVPPRDANQLTEALKVLIADKSLREQMGRESRRRAMKDFGLIQVVQQTLGIYFRLLNLRTVTKD